MTTTSRPRSSGGTVGNQAWSCPTRGPFLARVGFKVTAKQSRPICGLDGKYCFFRGKEPLYRGDRFRMSPVTGERYIASAHPRARHRETS